MDISIKNVLLAGIGAMSYTYEKAAGMVDELVKRGDITLSQAKDLNEELKRSATEKAANTGGNAGGIDEQTLKNILSGLNLATKDDVEDIKNRLDALENK